jgi:hypothetical protein
MTTPMEFICSCRETPTDANNPPYVHARTTLVTHDVEFKIPNSGCIYYENKDFTLQSLSQDENLKYNRKKSDDNYNYIHNRISKKSIDISICDAKRALLDFELKNNFTVIFGNRPCCEGYLITKLGFDFQNNEVNIEQECTCSCNYYMDTYEVHTYTIDDNYETLLLMFNTVIEYMKKRRPDSCNRAAYYGDIEGLKYAHKKGHPWNEFTCRTAAVKGQLVCLQYLHENGCPWDKTTIEYAEMGRPKKGHADCVEYAKEHGCPNV